MLELNPNQKKDITLTVKTVVIDPEAFSGADAEIVRMLKSIIEAEGEGIENLGPLDDAEPAQEIELCTEAVAEMSADGRVVITYRENEDDEQLSTVSKIIFNRDNPGLVIMSKEGPINTFLSFESGKMHVCTYNTPFMPIKVYVDSRRVDNRLLDGGDLKLNYVLNLGDSAPQHFIITVSAKDAPEDILKDFLA